MKVVIIGSGNVATILSIVINNAGHEIVQVISRNEDHARALAAKFKAGAASLNSEKYADADIYIMAINDTVLESVEKITALKNKFVVHTAGSVSMNVFKNITDEYGIIYPLQTLSSSISEIPEFPLLIEANSWETLDKIKAFAGSLSKLVIPVNETDRLHYHVAAVFASNFTNHLYAIAQKYCEMEKIDFKILLPLIKEVTRRIDSHSPMEIQTGPAMREDIFTLNRHLQALSAHPDLKYLYLKLSESILKLHEKH